MRSLLNKRGSILAVGAFVTLMIVLAVFKLADVYKASVSIVSEQNRKDAHMLSVAGLYVDTLDEVSWINKQLRRIGMLSALIVFAPELQPLIDSVQTAAQGLEAYQDLLLMKLKVYAPVLDIKLRNDNKLSLVCNYHYVEYRRQKPINLGFIRIPGLIEFNKNIFATACVKHKGVITNTRVCIDSDDYKQTEQEWFAPTEESWTVEVNNAY